MAPKVIVFGQDQAVSFNPRPGRRSGEREVSSGKPDPDFHMADLFGQILRLCLSDGREIGHAQDVLLFLAGASAPGRAPPTGAAECANMQFWLEAVKRDFTGKPRRLRLAAISDRQLFGGPRRRAFGLTAVERQLSRQAWIAGNFPTIADVALYPEFVRMMEWHPNRWRYCDVIAWIDKIEAVPGFPVCATPTDVVECGRGNS